MRPWLSAPQQLVESIGDAERVFPVEYDRLIVVPGILRRADDRKVPCREPAYSYRLVLPPGPHVRSTHWVFSGSTGLLLGLFGDRPLVGLTGQPPDRRLDALLVGHNGRASS